MFLLINYVLKIIIKLHIGLVTRNFKNLDIEYFFKEKTINELEDILTGYSIEQSDSGMKNNMDLIQVAEVVNSDADLTEDVGTINEDDYKMNISMKEEQKNVEFQETLKVDVNNIAKKKKKIWRPIYEVIDAIF